MDLGELYSAYFDECLQFACSLTQEISQAEDVTHNAFIRAMSALQLLEILSEPQRKSWLFTVVKNLFLDEQRKEKTRRQWAVKRPGAAANQSEAADLESPLDAEIRRWDLEQYLARIPEHQRDILVKRYWLNMTSREIGQALDMPAATVRYHLSEAVRQLKTLYHEEGNSQRLWQNNADVGRVVRFQHHE